MSLLNCREKCRNLTMVSTSLIKLAQNSCKRPIVTRWISIPWVQSDSTITIFCNANTSSTVGLQILYDGRLGQKQSSYEVMQHHLMNNFSGQWFKQSTADRRLSKRERDLIIASFK